MKKPVIVFIVMLFISMALLTWAKAPVSLNSDMIGIHHECKDVINSSGPISQSYKEYLNRVCSPDSGRYNSELEKIAQGFFIKIALLIFLISFIHMVYGYKYARSFRVLYSSLSVSFVAFFWVSGFGVAIILSGSLGLGSYFAHRLSGRNNIT